MQPSLDVLNSMVTFRVHLDEENEQNGCLKVISNSHSLGILPQERINQLVASEEPYSSLGRTILLQSLHR